jgi:hypothetical protein
MCITSFSPKSEDSDPTFRQLNVLDRSVKHLQMSVHPHLSFLFVTSQFPSGFNFLDTMHSYLPVFKSPEKLTGKQICAQSVPLPVVQEVACIYETSLYTSVLNCYGIIKTSCRTVKYNVNKYIEKCTSY